MRVGCPCPQIFHRKQRTNVSDKVDAAQLPGIARVLIQHQLLSPEQAREAHAKAQAAENGNFLDELVINSKVLNPLRLATFLAETFGMPLMDLASLDFSTLPLDQIDRKLLAETRVIPLIKRGNRLAVLLSDPTDNQAIERVKFQQQAIIDPIVVEHVQAGQADPEPGPEHRRQAGRPDR